MEKSWPQKKVESMRAKGQESHNRRVGNPPNSPLGPPPIESVGLTISHSTYFDKMIMVKVINEKVKVKI